jgi:WD40 repeat protein
MSRTFAVSFAAAAVAYGAADSEARAEHTIKLGGGFALSTLDPGRRGDIKVYDHKGHLNFTVTPFELAGGVNIAAGDVTGDGRADLIAGQAKGGEAKIFDGQTFEGFLKIEPFSADFKGGLSVAAGDVNGDGRADIIVGAGPGGGPHVKVFEGNGETLTSFNAFEPGFQGGVRVAVGDVNRDGVGDLIVTAAAGDGSVRTFDGSSGKPLGELLPFGDHKDGISVVAGRFLGEDVLFASKIAAGDGSVRVISLSEPGRAFDLTPFGDKYRGSLSLGFTTDGAQDVLVIGQAEGGAVGLLDVSRGSRDELGFSFGSEHLELSELAYFTPFGDDYFGGISVAGLNNLAAIPEPANWALMISGFALAGMASRRRLRGGEASVSAA